MAFISFFVLVFGNNFKRSPQFKNALLGLDLTCYPFGMILWELFSYGSIFLWLTFPGHGRPGRPNNKEKHTHLMIRCLGCKQFFNLFQPFAIGFKKLSNLFQYFAIAFHQFPIDFMMCSIDFHQFFLNHYFTIGF